jgi:hypothetical protein
VSRVLNTHTGCVSPQYHVLNDDDFTTLPSIGIPWTGFSPLVWHALLKLGYKRYLEPNSDHSGRSIAPSMLNDEWLTDPERILRDQLNKERLANDLISRSQSQREQTTIPDTVQSVWGGGSTNIPSPSKLPAQPSKSSEQPSEPSEPSDTSNHPSEPDTNTDYTPPSMVDNSDESDSGDDEEVITNSRCHPSKTTRSGRRVRPPDRMNLNAMKVKELNAMKANNSQELKKKLTNQTFRSGVLCTISCI